MQKSVFKRRFFMPVKTMITRVPKLRLSSLYTNTQETLVPTRRVGMQCKARCAANHDQRLAYTGRSASCTAFPRSSWERERTWLHEPALVALVPKLRLGNPVSEAPASRVGKLELPRLHSQAGAWERAKNRFSNAGFLCRLRR